MGGSPSVRAPEPTQMSNEERSMLQQQSASLAKQNEILNAMWGQQAPLLDMQGQIGNLQNWSQYNSLKGMMGLQPDVDHYNRQAIYNQHAQQGLQAQLLGLQGQYAPQQYAAAQDLLNRQRGAMSEFGKWQPHLLNEANAAGRGGTDMPTESADFAWRQAYMPEQMQGQMNVERALRDRTLAALSGNLPVDPALERDLAEQEQKLRGEMARQLGSGWETSTPGMEALANLRKRAEEARYGVRERQLGQAGGMYQSQSGTNAQTMLANQQLAQARLGAMSTNLANRGQDIQNVQGRQAGMMNLLQAPMGWNLSAPALMTSGNLGGLMNIGSGGGFSFDPGQFGQLASGYGSAASPYTQSRLQQDSARNQMALANGQSGGSPWGQFGMNLLGTTLGAGIGAVVPGLAGLGGMALGSSLFPGTFGKLFG